MYYIKVARKSGETYNLIVSRSEKDHFKLFSEYEPSMLSGAAAVYYAIKLKRLGWYVVNVYNQDGTLSFYYD